MKENIKNILYERGDIVLIAFPFTDLSGSKVRPSIILGGDRDDYVCVFITTQVPIGNNHILLSPDKVNNIKAISYIRYTKIASLNKSIILGKIGVLSKNDLIILINKLKDFLFL